MSDWFIRRDNEHEDIGPLRPSDLLKKVRSGEVTRETMLRKDGSAWFPARDVGGLFEAAMRPTIQYFCPQCRREVGEPPLVCPHCDFEVRNAITKITENAIANPTPNSNSGQAGRSVKSWLNKKRINKNDDDRRGTG